MYKKIITGVLGCVACALPLNAGVSVAACFDSRGGTHSPGSRWNDTYNGVQYSCVCDSRGGSCDPISSGGSVRSSGGSSGGYSKDAWKYQLMQGLVEGMMQGFMQGLENQQKEDAQRAEQQRQQQEAVRLQAEMQRQKTEAEKKAAREAWEKKQKEEALRQKLQNEQGTHDAADLSVKLGGGGGLQMVPIGGTALFGTGGGTGSLALKSVAGGEHDASKLSSLERAVCSRYFFDKANRSRTGEESRYYSSQADKVMSGGRYEEACDLSAKLPDVPEAPMPDQVWTPEEMAFFKKVEETSLKMREEVFNIRQIDDKLTENKKKMEEAKAKQEQVDMIIKDLNLKSSSATNEGEKAQVDTLLSEANALLAEAQSEATAAERESQKLHNDKKMIETKILNLRNTLESQIPNPKKTQEGINGKR